MRLALVCLAIVLPSAIQAQTVELPTRRAGQWEITMTQAAGGMPPITVQQCVDTDTDRQMMQAGMAMNRDACSQYDMRREGGGFVIESVCRMGPATTRTRAVFSGDWQTAYTGRITGTVEGMPGGPQATDMTQSARYVGACRDGLTPGDMVMPGGMRMNIRDVMRGLPRN